MKRVLGLDLGTNSIGWALIESDFETKKGNILGLGTRIIPMSQDILGDFDKGNSISQTADRTSYRGIRRLYQRDNLRRERLHRVLNVIDFLPNHYKEAIDFENRLGQFKTGHEPKINYKKNSDGKYEFVFKNSYNEMLNEMKAHQPDLFYTKKNGEKSKIPYDWTIYYLRKKALTNRVSKEELAWIILNFNQKRGYYQLRGEEEELESGKQKSFEILKVKDVLDSGEKLQNTGEKLFRVIFENGWEYDKLITKTENWVGKNKEFIVTTTIKKDGQTKRTYKAVNSEEDWAAIKAKTEKDIEHTGNYVGQYIYENLLENPYKKIRGKLIKTIERKYYRAELEAIIAEQTKHHPELRDKEKYMNCVRELYPRNEAHTNNIKDKSDFFKYLFVEDIIFYQRPLKSKKSTIANCQYEKRYFLNKTSGEKQELPLKGAPKSHPLYQEFRLWQFLSNLSIYEKEKVVGGKTELNFDITKDLLPNEQAWAELYKFLAEKKEIEQHQLLNFFADKKLIPKQKKDESNFRWNYPEDKKYPMGETRASFLARLKKVKGVKIEKWFNKDIELHLWHIIYSVKDKKEFEKALLSFAKKHKIDENSFFEAFKKIPPYKNEYGSYSIKALKKILPLMRTGEYWNINDIDSYTIERINKIIDGEVDEKIKNNIREKIAEKGLHSINQFCGLPTWLACYIVYDRHSESTANLSWKTPGDIDIYLNEFKQHSLRNPIVEQLVTETLRVVRDIWRYYGNEKEQFYQEIHLELGREMKNPADKRKRIAAKQQENENTNQRIKAILNELCNDGLSYVKSYSPSQQEILKIYEEGVFDNSPTEYNKIKIEEVEKIRKSNSPSKKDIQRYKLWLEQGYVSPYTGEVIKLTDLFTEKYQIEHIIPQSRYFDDSFNNKVICESEINPNPYKDNQTGYEFIKNKGGSIVPELSRNGKSVKLFTLNEYENHCKKYFKRNRSKLKNLLSEDIPEGFIERQMNDSRYISKFVKGLLSNIVKEENEVEAISKYIIPVNGSITAVLRQDWGLNDKWNELILSRFERLNQLTNSKDYTSKNSSGVLIPSVPDDIAKGFNKKRIDHRHHALDALVIAGCSRKHIQYLNSLNNENVKYNLRPQLLVKGANGKFTKHFVLPWTSFATDAKNALETTIVSFKQNLRVINKTNNKTLQWVNENGHLKKKLVKQTKGDSWAIRKSLHKETVSGKLDLDAPKGKIATATRTPLTAIKNDKHIAKITDKQIREVIIPNHLKNYLDENGKPKFELAFSPEGVEELNKNIQKLNNGKKHAPIYKVPMYEVGSKFPVSENPNSPKNQKYVEAAKGTNLFFAIYETKQNNGENKRQYFTVPLNEVIEHQKQVANLPKQERTPIPIYPNKGRLLFTLSPNDLVYVLDEEEINNPNSVDFKNLTKNQISRIYKMEKASKGECYFVRHDFAILIKQYDSKSKFGELSSQNKLETTIDLENPIRIKEKCWKLKVDRLGNIVGVFK